MTEDVYKKLYEQNSEGINSVYKLKDEVGKLTTIIESHIEGDKLRDYKMDSLIKVITIDNGKPSVLSRLRIMEELITYLKGATKAVSVVFGVIVILIGALWSVLKFVIPLLKELLNA